MSDSIAVGIVGAGNRGQSHAGRYAGVPGADIVAVADVDTERANALAEEYGAEAYGAHADLLDDAGVDAISVCVHNNLHEPIAVDALEAGVDVFCEKPMAGSYADAKHMYEVAQRTGQELAVQNTNLYTPETRAARRLIEAGELGEVYYGRVSRTRRRGRPYVDGYGAPAFVSEESAGGGPVYDIGTYDIGQVLYLVGNADVERVGGRTFEFTDDAYDAALTGPDESVYRERLAESGYDVEDAGAGFVSLADGTLLSVTAAWHMFLPGEPNAVVGSQGGVTLDPFELHTTTADYETTTDFDLGEYERRQSLIEEVDADRRNEQLDGWVQALRGRAEALPTAEVALNSMLVMEGIYLSQEAGRELTADAVAERSESTAFDL